MTRYEVTLVPRTRHALVAVEPACLPLDASRLALLSDAERSAAARMPAGRRARYVQGRALLRRLVADLLGTAPEEVALEVALNGEVHLRDRARAGVSIAHTCGYVAAAAWPGGSVGVDVQDPPDAPQPRLERRCLNEYGAKLCRLSDQERAAALARVWSVQEACIKASGARLSSAPWHIPVPPGRSSGHWGEVAWVALDGLWPVGLAVAGQRARRAGRRAC